MKYLTYIFAVLVSFRVMAFDLYTNDHNEGLNCSQLGMLLNEEYAKDSSAPVLFYVHGRGKHPQKGINYLPEMERRYKLDVIMFHWNSWINMVSRPEESAIDASENLARCFYEIEKFEMTKPELLEKRPLLFMSHSMGNIVVYALIKRELFLPILPALFESVTLNAADVPLADHKDWISNIKLAPKIFITLNNDDSVLYGSKLIDYKDLKLLGGRRLGRSYSYILGEDELAPNAIYLDFSALTTGGHQHFLSNGLFSKGPLTKIFNDIFHEADTFQIKYHESSFNGVYKFSTFSPIAPFIP